MLATWDTDATDIWEAEITDITGQAVLDFSTATRKSHPETSRIAEENVTKSGKRAGHCRIVLNALRQHNGSTSAELAQFLEGILTHPQVWRRRKDLMDNGYVKVEGVRNGYGIWWIR